MNRKFSYIIIIASTLMIAGCGMTRLERDFGTSHKLARFNQTLNPEAEKNLNPVAGMSGQAAQFVVEKYNKEFEKVTVTPVYSINIGNLGK